MLRIHELLTFLQSSTKSSRSTWNTISVCRLRLMQGNTSGHGRRHTLPLCSQKHAEGSLSRLFYFRYDYADAEPQPTPFDDHVDLCVVKVDVRGTPGYNDLLSCLSADLFSEHNQRSQAIFQPSEVVAFQIFRSHVPNEREVFSFPPYLYLDQFLKENAELASAKRSRQWDLANDIQLMLARRSELTRYEVCASRIIDHHPLIDFGFRIPEP